MTRSEAIEKWIMPACKKVWNEKRCNEILKALDQEPCEDAISREKVLQIVRAWFDRDAKPSELKNEIENLPPVQPKTWWIPVSKRLPEPESHVLISLDDGYVTDDYYGLYGTNDFDAFKDGAVEEKVKAWMPLPEPYKAKRSEVQE